MPTADGIAANIAMSWAVRSSGSTLCGHARRGREPADDDGWVMRVSADWPAVTARVMVRLHGAGWRRAVWVS